VKRRERSPELTPEERDIRTVFCMQLSNRIRPRDLEDFFSPVGKVKTIYMKTIHMSNYNLYLFDY
jgi:RNA-binding protein 39